MNIYKTITKILILTLMITPIINTGEDFSCLGGSNIKVGIVSGEDNIGAKISTGGYYLIFNGDLEYRKWGKVMDYTDQNNNEICGYLGVGLLNICQIQFGYGMDGMSGRIKTEIPFLYKEKKKWYERSYPPWSSRPIPLIEIYLEDKFPEIILGVALGLTL